jgi:hypothetical protein
MDMRIFRNLFRGAGIQFLLLCITCTSFISCTGEDDFTVASVLIVSDLDSCFRQTVLQLMDEEISLRSSHSWDHADTRNKNQAVIALAISGEDKGQGNDPPHRSGSEYPENQAEGYRIFLDKENGENTLWIIGADKRGLLFGIGKFFRILNISSDEITLSGEIDIASAPAYPIRGHQLGYRNTANSWDAWTVRQYEQYIRELVLFGSNCIEDIPFQSDTQSVHMLIPHREMHIKISDLCEKYDVDYWVWTPASGNLAEESIREAELIKHEEFYKSIPRLDAIFFPGGDPGDNHPKHVMPHLKELSKLLKKYHPDAGVWISLQGFDREKINYFLDYLHTYRPDWLTGVVHGPGSPPVDLERDSLPDKYLHRLYGDITHTIRCSYPVENWDQAFALTQGREPTNPQPAYYAGILRKDIPYSNGFLSYSDGVNDDVNKVIWNQVAWNPDIDVREIVVEYCHFFFGSDHAQEAADGILALEQNWNGSLIQNEAVEETLALWKKLESSNPALAANWRWQQLVMRAYYDAFLRARLIYEQELEKEANLILSRAVELGPDTAILRALAVLQKADTNPAAVELREKVVVYCDALFKSVGLQTSVPLYQASGYERGCILDFIDYPLNNRWWLEDEFLKIQEMDSEEDKLRRIEVLRSWSKPGPGQYYDNISSVSEGPRVISRTDDAIDYAWWDYGLSRKRLSTQLFQFSPTLQYTGLKAETDYLIRVAGYGEALIRANGTRLEATLYNKELETFKEFILPKELIKEGSLKLTFDRPDEAHLNWRKYSKVTDLWLIPR